MDGNLRASLLVIGLCLAVTFLLYIAADKAVLDIEENGCEMTYMYEYPKYIKVNLKKKLSQRYPRYGLYIYGEGSYADELRRSKPTGIPVLFIPGNAGSHKQVRSLASVALRKAETHANHFNYFTVDFDEDLGGLFGGVLMDQANFVHSCLRHILRMYKGNKHPPDSVVIIGHSMGGLISRALYLLDGFQPKLVHFIFTLGTPHLEPVIPLDIQLTSFYSQVNKFWHSSPVVNNVTIISLAGGSRDILVPSKLSALHYASSSALQYSSVTTSVPRVWLTIDHLALCWCKQLVLVINRVLFDMIDMENNQITRKGIVQNKSLKKHFGYFKEESDSGKTGYGENQKLPSVYNLTVLDAGKQYMVSVSGTILIPITPGKNNAHFLALTNSDFDVQIKTCAKVQNETCMGFMDFSLESLPTASGKVQFIDLSGNTLAKFSHIMVSSLKHKSFSLMALQFTSKSNIDKVFNDFNMFSSSQTFVDTGALFINVSLPMVRYSFDVFLITVKKINCENANRDLLKGRVHVSWFDEDIYAYSADHSQELDILLKLHASKPITVLESPQLHIWNIDKCSFEVTMQQQFAHTLGQLFKMYAVEIPQWVYFWITTILTLQMSEMSHKGIWSSTWSTVTSNKLHKIIPLFLLIASETPTKILRMFLLGETSSFQPYDWLLPKFFVILSALAAMVFINFVLGLTISSSALLLLCCSPTCKPGKPHKENGISSLWFSIFLVFALLFLSLFCSSVALYLLTFLTYIYCCKKKKEHKHLEENTDSTQPTLANQLNFRKTILNLLVMLSWQISPAFIVWLKVLPFSWSLPSDPYPFLVLLLAPTVICSIQMDLNMPPKYSSWVILSIWCVGFLLSSLAQLPYLIGTILLITDFFVLCKHKRHIKSY